jgi:hypothetical protein
MLVALRVEDIFASFCWNDVVRMARQFIKYFMEQDIFYLFFLGFAVLTRIASNNCSVVCILGAVL